MWMSRRSRPGAVTTCSDGSRRCRLDRVAVLQHVDLRGGRRHALPATLLPDERVDEGALAGVELADDDQQEELVELLDRSLERGLMLGRGVEPHQRGAQRASTRRSSLSSSSCSGERSFESMFDGRCSIRARTPSVGSGVRRFVVRRCGSEVLVRGSKVRQSSRHANGEPSSRSKPLEREPCRTRRTVEAPSKRSLHRVVPATARAPRSSARAQSVCGARFTTIQP